MKRSWHGICPRPVALAAFLLLVPLVLALWAGTIPATSAARALLRAALG